jgi:hypothetical protein
VVCPEEIVPVVARLHLLEPVEVRVSTGTSTLAYLTPESHGGGHGRLARKHGLACNSVVGAEVVTADGQLVRADPQGKISSPAGGRSPRLPGRTDRADKANSGGLWFA